ncbi:MAG: hypothetical protein V3U02_04435 [Calditrichia bacterium]
MKKSVDIEKSLRFFCSRCGCYYEADGEDVWTPNHDIVKKVEEGEKEISIRVVSECPQCEMPNSTFHIIKYNG